MRSRPAHSLPLVRYSAFIAWGVDMRHFHQLVLSLSHQGKEAAMMAWRSCGPCSRLAHRPVLRPAFSFRLYVRCSLFIRAVASRERRRFSSITAPRLSRAPVPSNPPPCRPLPHSLRLFRLVPHSLRPSRLASRLIVPFLVSSRLARCAERLAARLAVAPFCSARFFVLPMPCRHHRLTTG